MDELLPLLFFAGLLLIVSLLVVFRWSQGKIADDVSGLMGAFGVFVACVFIFGVGSEHLEKGVGAATKLVESVLRPIAVIAACWTGFMFGGTTGLTVAAFVTAPSMFPGWSDAGKALSYLSPFALIQNVFFGKKSESSWDDWGLGWAFGSKKEEKASNPENPFAGGKRAKKKV